MSSRTPHLPPGPQGMWSFLQTCWESERTMMPVPGYILFLGVDTTPSIHEQGVHSPCSRAAQPQVWVLYRHCPPSPGLSFRLRCMSSALLAAYACGSLGRWNSNSSSLSLLLPMWGPRVQYRGHGPTAAQIPRPSACSEKRPTQAVSEGRIKCKLAHGDQLGSRGSKTKKGQRERFGRTSTKSLPVP